MRSKADIRRRWFGAIFLLVSIGMLVAGQTVLSERLSPLGFIVFWLACLVCTCLAILVALIDVWVIRSRSREEQRAFLDDTIKEIARRKEERAQQQPSRSRDSRPE